jgi:FkbM family methyltransferase
MSDFADQVPKEFEFCGYQMLVPSAHPIIKWSTPGGSGEHPYRENGLAQISRALTRAGKPGVVIDIGANIGDTLAVIACNSELMVHCVEASNFYTAYLRENIQRHFRTRATLEQCFVTAKPNQAPMGLFHWAGTAKPGPTPFLENCGAVPIRDLLSRFEQVALLKLDTDGQDLDLIMAVFEHGPGESREKRCFPIYFELEMPEPSEQMCLNWIAFFHRMADLGYEIGVFWDDPGRLLGLFELKAAEYIRNIVNYLTHFRHRPVSGFDVCLVHREDQVVLRELRSIISDGVMLPV